jgi:hypothetical protein
VKEKNGGRKDGVGKDIKYEDKDNNKYYKYDFELRRHR